MAFLFQDEELYEQTSDVRAQLRFFEQLERLEKQRKDEQEREILLKAAKVPTPPILTGSSPSQCDPRAFFYIPTASSSELIKLALTSRAEPVKRIRSRRGSSRRPKRYGHCLFHNHAELLLTCCHD